MSRAPTLARRAVLRGAGVALGLPLLEAMLDPQGRLLGGRSVGDAWAGTEEPVPLVLFFWPNGVDLGDFLPAETGAGWVATPGLAPLDPWRDDFVLVHGTRKAEAWIGQDIDGDAHSRGHATFATGYGLTQLGVGGPSLERAVADALWQERTPLKSLTVALGSAEFVRTHVSWADATTPVPPFRDPQALYDYLFPGLARKADPLAKARQSVLDFVKADAAQLEQRLGAADCQRIEQYFTSVRELEVRMSSVPACTVPERPEAFDLYDRSNDKGDVLMDLFMLAFECGLTSYGTFQLCSRWDARQFPWLGIPDWDDGHHGISHDVSPAGRAAYEAIVADQMRRFARMLERAKAIPMPTGGTLLDEGLFFTAPEHGSSWDDGHYMGHIPVILAGGARGRLKSRGQVVKPDPMPKYGDVLLTVAQLAGAPFTEYGVYGRTPVASLTG